MEVLGYGGKNYCMIAQSQSGQWFWYDSVDGPGKDATTKVTADLTPADGDPMCPKP